MDDIDFIVGALLEAPVKGAKVGPTSRCIIADSFYRYKVGDRFFYDVPDQPGSFTAGRRTRFSSATAHRRPVDIFRNCRERPGVNYYNYYFYLSQNRKFNSLFSYLKKIVLRLKILSNSVLLYITNSCKTFEFTHSLVIITHRLCFAKHISLLHETFLLLSIIHYGKK